MEYHLANHPTIHVELHDDGTASLVKDCWDATYHLTRIAYWDPNSGGHGNRLSAAATFFYFANEQAYRTINNLLTSGGASKVFPIKEMRPEQPRLGVRVFTKSSEVLLAVQLGTAPHWIDILRPEQLLLSYDLVPVDRIAGQLSILDP